MRLWSTAFCLVCGLRRMVGARRMGRRVRGQGEQPFIRAKQRSVFAPDFRNTRRATWLRSSGISTPLPILYSSWRSEEVVGFAPLRSLADELYGQRDPGEVMFVGQAQEIEEQGDDFILKLPLPHIELDKIRLTKRGDGAFHFDRQLQA